MTPPSFERLYREHFRFVWRVLRQLGVPESDAPDATQDVFVVAHGRLSDFEGRSSMTTWLYGICFRVASHRRRRERTSRELSAATLPDVATEPGEDPAARAERREAVQVLEWILGRMPEDQRTVFVAFELEELGGDEIAIALEIPVGTVHSRLRLARAFFRKEIARLAARERFGVGEGEQP